MKATTTVTCAKYCDTTSSKFNPESLNGAFVSPQQMIRRLIPYCNFKKQMEALKNTEDPRQVQEISKENLVADIQNLQQQLDNIQAEIIESENLLNVRDSLYAQLDFLREERQQIESDIFYLESQNFPKKVININLKPRQAYKQMNQRLRRRMNQIREYVLKMEVQNKKIQESIQFSNILNIQNNYKTQTISNARFENAYFDRKDQGSGKVNELITKLHIKKQEAFDKVRRQEQEINIRNQMKLASFSTSSQVGVRSLHGGSFDRTGRRTFYSPEHRY